MEFKINQGIMMRYLLISFLLICGVSQADSIKNYMDIANNIPQMEIKADAQAQAWARSARHVLTITCESIAETLASANEASKSQGKPLFCLTKGAQLNSVMLNELIQQTYKELSSQQSDKDQMTVSQVAWLGITKQFPCQSIAAKNEMAQIGLPSNQY